jgi:hypothetical protein
MAADHVDPHALKLDLERIASTLPRASDGALAGCCMRESGD